MALTRNPGCGAMRAIAAFACAASGHAATYTYVGPGGEIPDLGDVTSPIDVPEDFLVVDVTVHIEGLQHDACGQLVATLVQAEHGLSIRLLTTPGGDTDNTNFNGSYRFNNNFEGNLSQMAEGLGDMDDLPSGDYFPRLGDLNDALGANGAGTWQLEIEDQIGGTVGSFTQWTLEFQGAGPVAPVLYVDDDAGDSGDGLDWNSAYRDLRHALLVAQFGDGVVTEIRVGEGHYRPSLRTEFGEPKSATFTLIDGVALRGGYAGIGAADPDERDPRTNASVLNGDILGNDVPGSPYADPSREDNAAHVITGTGTGPTTELDGFFITAGVTVGSGSAELPRSGGGLVNAPGSPTVRGCTFTENWADRGGGAIYNEGASAPTIVACRFLSNETDGHGGGVRNQSCSPAILDCLFMLNVADGGGAGIMNIEASPSITGCSFFNNDTAGAGGAVRNDSFSGPTVSACSFIGNSAGFSGGAMFSQMQSDAIVTDCVFEDNIASEYGGAVGSAAFSRLSFADCMFSRNLAGRDGGAMGLFSEDVVIERCVFTENRCNELGGALFIDETARIDACAFVGNAAEFGGGVYNERTGTTIVNSTFQGNTADFGGGLYSIDHADGLVLNTIFAGNHATRLGGGAYEHQSSLTQFTNCLFTGNTADLDGAGLVVRQSLTSVINCTFSLNDAGGGGGGVSVRQTSAPTLVNCVLWANTDADLETDAEGEQVLVEPDATLSVDYCCIEGLSGGLGGVGNIGTDPLFIDPNGVDDIPGTLDDDARLQVGSTSQDTGDVTALPADVLDLDDDGDFGESIPVDLDGAPRVHNAIVDRGAYEVQRTPCPEDIDESGAVDFGDVLAILATWGSAGGPEDLDGSGTVDFGDILMVLAAWGPCA